MKGFYFLLVTIIFLIMIQVLHFLHYHHGHHQGNQGRGPSTQRPGQCAHLLDQHPHPAPPLQL
ncbi:unnamed protein product, partial [Pipistrellus nathusii]